jgi:LacI family transcriptional regulator
MSPTLLDIAKETGTSISTVSRVLAGGNVARRISLATRQKVMQAADRMGYRPNLIARTLRTRRSQTVALLVSDIANPFFAQIGSLVEQKLHRFGYSLMLCNSGEQLDREAEYLQLLLQKAIDGLIFVPVLRGKKALQEFIPGKLPLVILDRPIAGISSCVYSDQEQSSRILCDELDRAGVKKIVVVSGPSEISTHHRRAQVAGERFELLGRYEGAAQKQTGQEAMARFKGLRPDAIVCTNNFLAQGVIDSIVDLNNAPIIGSFDEVPMMHLLPLPIVLSCQDIPLLADGCVKQLISQLNGDQSIRPIVLSAKLTTNPAFDARIK